MDTSIYGNTFQSYRHKYRHFEKQMNQVFHLAKSLQSWCGIRIEDNRQVGGELWVHHLVTDDEVARRLQKARFRFHPASGCWSK